MSTKYSVFQLYSQEGFDQLIDRNALTTWYDKLNLGKYFFKIYFEI